MRDDFQQDLDNIDNSVYENYVAIHFNNSQRMYYFGVKGFELKKDDFVVVETMRGIELGVVSSEPVSMAKYKSSLGLRPVLRVATERDLKMQEANKKDAIYSMEICKSEIDRLKLEMNLISCEYSLDKSKVLFTYLADERVDFRELIKILASRLHTRIELRQIGSRDKAKMVGGLGMCGLPLCCTTFLNEFDGISINRAKNQMLAINIPKLSGHCGKLMCCLKYEDEAYTEAKKDFPEIGTKVFIDKVEYFVAALNVLSKTVKVENNDDYKFLSLEDFKSQTNWRARRNDYNDKK